ncbi:hypothetical protein HDU96_007241, partial [Phlyctochytrium bullatum]
PQQEKLEYQRTFTTSPDNWFSSSQPAQSSSIPAPPYATQQSAPQAHQIPVQLKDAGQLEPHRAVQLSQDPAVLQPSGLVHTVHHNTTTVPVTAAIASLPPSGPGRPIAEATTASSNALPAERPMLSAISATETTSVAPDTPPDQPKSTKTSQPPPITLPEWTAPPAEAPAIRPTAQAVRPTYAIQDPPRLKEQIMETSAPDKLPPINISRTAVRHRCRCFACDRGICLFLFHGTHDEPPSDADLAATETRVLCSPCFATSTEKSEAARTVAGPEPAAVAVENAKSRKRRVKKVAQDTPLKCDACTTEIGFGGLRAIAAGRREPVREWLEPPFGVEAVCDHCVQNFDNAAAAAPSALENGILASSSSTAVEIAPSHIRYGDLNQFQVLSFRCPFEPIEDAKGNVINSNFDPDPIVERRHDRVMAKVLARFHEWCVPTNLELLRWKRLEILQLYRLMKFMQHATAQVIVHTTHLSSWSKLVKRLDAGGRELDMQLLGGWVIDHNSPAFPEVARASQTIRGNCGRLEDGKAGAEEKAMGMMPIAQYCKKFGYDENTLRDKLECFAITKEQKELMDIVVMRWEDMQMPGFIMAESFRSRRLLCRIIFDNSKILNPLFVFVMLFGWATRHTQAPPNRRTMENLPGELYRRILFFVPPIDVPQLIVVSRGFRHVFRLADWELAFALNQIHEHAPPPELECGFPYSNYLQNCVPFPNLPPAYALAMLFNSDGNTRSMDGLDVLEWITNGEISAYGHEQKPSAKKAKRSLVEKLLAMALRIDRTVVGFSMDLHGADDNFLLENLSEIAVRLESKQAIRLLVELEKTKIPFVPKKNVLELLAIGRQRGSGEGHVLDHTDFFLHQMLHCACKCQSESIVRFLIQEFSENLEGLPDIVSVSKPSLFYLAAQTGNKKIVELLLSRYVRDKCYARARKGFIRFDPEISCRDLKTGATPLHETTDAGIASLFLRYGANPNRANLRGQTPLHIACKGLVGAEEIALIRTLLQHGADATVADESGRTPLHYVAEGYRYSPRLISIEAARLLLDAGADPSQGDHQGRTPLFIACTEASCDLLQMLLGSDIWEITTNDGILRISTRDTPLDVIRRLIVMSLQS